MLLNFIYILYNFFKKLNASCSPLTETYTFYEHSLKKYGQIGREKIEIFNILLIVEIVKLKREIFML